MKGNTNLTVSDGTSGDGQGSADEILLSTNRLIVVSTSGFGYFKSADPVLREQIFIALANYLASRAAAELDSNAQEATEGERNTVWDRPSAPEAVGPSVASSSERPGSTSGQPYQYYRMA